ncbi:putative RNA-binding Zn ribbon-like protein [Sporomusaceae bacterium BoRhaA]|uniref:CGNR zinc finger domain-containing protein n=1 Tax=Pelorhabdus rhamnosifermentans TaxID=2772457 RepID=UPI0028AF9EB8|nr:CGNR zinc finger domain-containing protein [Pelorhabdus rhamnosifermentans]MBU2700037.1 putative RNA-binding Zn ribbon-like protein [Pelorhabdus rhamnosifermentans]
MKKLCLDFLNTRWYLTHKFNKEILVDPTLLKKFFEIRQLHVEITPSVETIEELLELRTFLAKVLEDYTRENSIALEAIERINHYLTISTFRRTMEQGEHGFRITIQPLSFDWNWIIVEITASFVELIEYGDNKRIKICENPDCKWFFYDETKSRTKRWCDDKCASLMKVRKFRAKQKND